jgi:2'-5' RNA ligase
MGSDSNGVLSGVPAGQRLNEQRLNVYALVTYIPDPLGRFLDDLRRELAPGCNPHAHVSVLPPRPLGVDWHVAGEQVRELTETQAPFVVGLADIRIFPVTNVIYIEVGSGATELRHMHDAINRGALAFEEPFVYQPHITLAQEILQGEVQAVHELAKRRWKEFTGPHAFRAERAAFVQSTMSNCWIDLAEFEFGAVDLCGRPVR